MSGKYRCDSFDKKRGVIVIPLLVIISISYLLLCSFSYNSTDYVEQIAFNDFIESNKLVLFLNSSLGYDFDTSNTLICCNKSSVAPKKIESYSIFEIFDLIDNGAIKSGVTGDEVLLNHPFQSCNSNNLNEIDKPILSITVINHIKIIDLYLVYIVGTFKFKDYKSSIKGLYCVSNNEISNKKIITGIY